MRPIVVSYLSIDSSVRYSSVTIVCICGAVFPLGNRFFSATGSRTLAFGYRKPTLATAGLLANCIALFRLVFLDRFFSLFVDTMLNCHANVMFISSVRMHFIKFYLKYKGKNCLLP